MDLQTWPSKHRSICKNAGLVSGTFIFSMCFNSFHRQMDFRQRRVTSPSSKHQFLQCFWQVLCRNDVLDKRGAVAETARLQPGSASDLDREVGVKPSLGIAPGGSSSDPESANRGILCTTNKRERAIYIYIYIWGRVRLIIGLSTGRAHAKITI